MHILGDILAERASLSLSHLSSPRSSAILFWQMGFINVLVKPLYDEWHKLLGETVQPGIDCLNGSLEIWKNEGAGPAAGWESEEFVR